MGESDHKPSRTCREHTIGLASNPEIRRGSGADFEISYHINPECNTDKEIFAFEKNHYVKSG